MIRLLSLIGSVLVAGSLAGTPAAADDHDTCQKGSGDPAIAACTRLIASNKFNGSRLSGIYSNRGNKFGANGELDRAVADYTEAIRLDPKNAVPFNNRGNAYKYKDDLDRAIADLSEGIRLNPKYALAFRNRGLANDAKGERDRAIADYSEAIRLDPKYAVAFNSRGIAYNAKGDQDRAIADYSEAIQLNPAFGIAFNNRGNAYRAKGDQGRAIVDYNEAIRFDPKYAFAFSNRGNAYRDKGDQDRAIVDYNEAIRLDPKYANAFNNRGEAYKAKGDLDRAISDYTEALRLNPNHADARANLEQVRTALAAASQPSTPSAPPDVTASATPERRVALVIGNSEYRSVTMLPNPRRDARAVAEALRQAGFQTVTLETDLTHDAMVKALRSFRTAADAADWALVYFAGHGLEINRINYLVPTDAKIEDERDVKAETVSYEDMLAAVGGARSLRLVVLDACRVNPFKERMRRIVAASRTATDRGLAPPPDPEPGTLVVYSAKDGNVAADDVDGANSPFARAFLAQLKVPGREARRLFDYVRDDVLDATNKRQQPFTYGSLPGRRDYFFVSAR